MKKILALILFFIPIVEANIIITEIMADPIADETLNEWIEIYNNSTEEIDIQDWQIGDEKDTDTLEGGLYDKKGTIIPPEGYAIITDDSTRVYNNFNVSNDVIKLYTDDGSIGNGLKNSGETIWLYNEEGKTIDNITYEETVEGQSYSLFNDTWQNTEPSPGHRQTPKTGCDWKVEIISNQSFIEEPEFKIIVRKIYGEKNNLTLNREVLDISGETIKEYKELDIENALNQRTYSYSPNLKPDRAYTIHAKINSSCDINQNNDFIEKSIFVQSIKPEESEVEIIKIYDLGKDKEAKWGQTIKIKIDAYKGNTNKKTINIRVDKEKEKASKQTRVNLDKKYTAAELTLLLQLKPNCDRKLKDGEYKIIAEGLDSRSMKKISISGENKDTCKVIKEVIEKNNTCEKVECNTSINTKKYAIQEKKENNKNYIKQENTEEITGSVVYESKSKKTRKYGIYFFISLLALITIALWIKK